MIDQDNQSPEAKAQQVCHTDGECDLMYQQLTPEQKAPALALLALRLAPVASEIKKEYEAHPKTWIAPYHFYWGMSVRNLLRSEGFGEQYFGVHNLDDIYVRLVEEALGLITESHRYRILKPIVLGFLTPRDSYDTTIDNGELECDGSTIWYIDSEGNRHESNTMAFAISQFETNGWIERI